MDVTKVAAIAVMGVVALLIFKQYKPEWGIPTRLVLGLAMGVVMLSGVGAIVSFALEISEGQALTGDMWQILLKALGVAFVTEIAMGICRDSGEGGLAMWVEMTGKTALLLLALPLIKEVLSTAKTLLGMGG
ncbi:MAG: stage III sporulation AC/AD family protein [Clostridia bacterium]|nr:stage III sporulation AC/AD family protein [Clostridia bacterium]